MLDDGVKKENFVYSSNTRTKDKMIRTSAQCLYHDFPRVRRCLREARYRNYI